MPTHVQKYILHNYTLKHTHTHTHTLANTIRRHPLTGLTMTFYPLLLLHYPARPSQARQGEAPTAGSCPPFGPPKPRSKISLFRDLFPDRLWSPEMADPRGFVLRSISNPPGNKKLDIFEFPGMFFTKFWEGFGGVFG